MTGTPRRPAGDLKVILDEVGKLNVKLTSIQDEMRRNGSRADARADDAVARISKTEATLDTIQDTQERHNARSDRRISEIISTTNSGYRKVQEEVSGLHERVETINERVSEGLREAQGKIGEIRSDLDAYNSKNLGEVAEGSARGASKGSEETRKLVTGAVIMGFISASSTIIALWKQIWPALESLAGIHTGGGPTDPGY